MWVGDGVGCVVVWVVMCGLCGDGVGCVVMDSILRGKINVHLPHGKDVNPFLERCSD